MIDWIEIASNISGRLSIALATIYLFYIQFNEPKWRWSWAATLTIVFFVFAFTGEILRLLRLHNIWWYALFAAVFFLLVFHRLTVYFPRLKKIGIVTAVTVFAGSHLLTQIEMPFTWLSSVIEVLRVSLIFLAFLAMLYHLISHDESTDVMDAPDFWFLSGLVIYSGFMFTLVTKEFIGFRLDVSVKPLVNSLIQIANIGWAVYFIIGFRKWKKNNWRS